MSVVLVSLFPLETTGGGELYTVETAQAIAATGERVVLAAPVDVPPLRSDLQARLRLPFIWVDPAGTDAPAVGEWADVLRMLPDADYIWAHQYLSSDLVFDLLSSAASDQELLLTSLGYEPLRSVFADLYQPCRHHHVIEISNYAATRAARFAPRATGLHAAVWRRELLPLGQERPREREFLALGRVLPHKGLETTIDAIGPDEVLHVVGPMPDPAYAAFLRSKAQQKQVEFHGVLPRADVKRLLQDTTGLVSASTHHLFDGRRIDQPELLGLVLCEALRDGTLPVASDVPAFAEVMGAVGLSDWTFREGNPADLHTRLQRLESMSALERRQRLELARAALLEGFAWDDYWPRVRTRVEELRQCA